VSGKQHAILFELGPRKVISILAEDGGYEVTLECGHHSWWAIAPPLRQAHCSRCLDLVLERLKKGKQWNE
jgi:hypothetical protein